MIQHGNKVLETFLVVAIWGEWVVGADLREVAGRECEDGVEKNGTTARTTRDSHFKMTRRVAEIKLDDVKECAKDRQVTIPMLPGCGRNGGEEVLLKDHWEARRVDQDKSESGEALYRLDCSLVKYDTVPESLGCYMISDFHLRAEQPPLSHVKLGVLYHDEKQLQEQKCFHQVETVTW
jgi:hypothetical protein